MSLNDAEKGNRVKVLNINGDSVLKKRLASMGIRKNCDMSVEEVSLGHSNMKISLGHSEIALRSSEAKNIQVEAE